VAKSLELIGGKWKGGKIFGFVFPNDPTDLLQQIASGEKRNIKKEFQFFETPATLADKLVDLAEIQPEDEVLEPSAGQGSIVKAIHRNTWDARTVWGYELMEINQTFLNKIIGFRLLGNDFLIECDTHFDKIIANPPFSKNQDIDHIYKMYDCLKDGGRIVTIASRHWETSNNKKESEFRDWLDMVGAKIQKIESGAFKESGTMIGSVIIVIDKI
jgi:predicted RNA methylase